MIKKATIETNRGRIVACDVDDRRLQTLDDLCRRLGVSIVESYRLHPERNDEPPPGLFDSILVDVPCSNTGVLGRRPEVRWRLRERDFRRLVALQTRLLRQAGERIGRLEQAIREALADWTLAPIVPALMAMRGLDLVAAVTLLAEIGDLSRFENPRQLMAYVGLVPGERSTGESIKRGSITKAGNGRARRVLVEAAWAYRHPPRVGYEKQVHVAAAPRRAREIAWKAQVRLCKRFRTLSRKGKKSTVVATAIARELAAFVWAIAREVGMTPGRAA